VLIFRFGLIFIKKIIKLNIFLNQNWFKSTGFSSVQFFRAKTSSNKFSSVFQFWLGFFRFFQFCSIFSGFFSSGLVRFGSVFPVPGLKNQTEPVGFFKILIGFFSRFCFFGYFFRFSRFNLFFGFFEHPYLR